MLVPADHQAHHQKKADHQAHHATQLILVILGFDDVHADQAMPALPFAGELAQAHADFSIFNDHCPRVVPADHQVHHDALHQLFQFLEIVPFPENVQLTKTLYQFVLSIHGLVIVRLL